MPDYFWMERNFFGAADIKKNAALVAAGNFMITLWHEARLDVAGRGCRNGAGGTGRGRPAPVRLRCFIRYRAAVVDSKSIRRTVACECGGHARARCRSCAAGKRFPTREKKRRRRRTILQNRRVIESGGGAARIPGDSAGIRPCQRAARAGESRTCRARISTRSRRKH